MPIRVSEREKKELPRCKLKDILESNQNIQIKDLCLYGRRLFKDVSSPLNDLLLLLLLLLLSRFSRVRLCATP